MALTIEEYQAKVQARLDRIQRAADRAQSQSDQSLETARDRASVIPFGQPMLTDHYSYNRDRNYRAKISRGYERGFALAKKAEEYRSRAASIEANDAIYSDDPRAIERLEAKIKDAQENQETWKAVNAAYRKFKKNPDAKIEFPDGYEKAIKGFEPEWSGDKPIPSFQLSNNNANINRMKKRLEEVRRKQTAQDSEITVDEIRFEFVPTENRIRIHFPRRVSLDTYKMLKRHGYRNARSFSKFTFSAYHNANAMYLARQFKEDPNKVEYEGGK